MQPRILLISLIFVFSTPTLADVDLGIGISSAQSGRTIPALTGTLHTTDWAFTASMTGAQTPISFYSSYTLSMAKHLRDAEFFWGKLRVAFGASLFYGSYGYRTSPTAAATKKSDTNFGPAFNMRWHFAGPVYFGLDAMYGILANPLMLPFAMSSQDLVIFSVGANL